MLPASDERLRADLCCEVKGRACCRHRTIGCMLTNVAMRKVVLVGGIGLEAAC